MTDTTGCSAFAPYESAADRSCQAPAGRTPGIRPWRRCVRRSRGHKRIQQTAGRRRLPGPTRHRRTYPGYVGARRDALTPRRRHGACPQARIRPGRKHPLNTVRAGHRLMPGRTSKSISSRSTECRPPGLTPWETGNGLIASRRLSTACVPRHSNRIPGGEVALRLPDNFIDYGTRARWLVRLASDRSLFRALPGFGEAVRTPLFVCPQCDFSWRRRTVASLDISRRSSKMIAGLG